MSTRGSRFREARQADSVSFGLPRRVVMTLLLAIPGWLAVSALRAALDGSADPATALLGLLGLLVLILFGPKYLQDIWRPTHTATKQAIAAATVQRRFQQQLQRRP